MPLLARYWPWLALPLPNYALVLLSRFAVHPSLYFPLILATFSHCGETGLTPLLVLV